MNRKSIFVILSGVVVLLALIVSSKSYAATVYCSGPIQRITSRNPIIKVANNQTLCFTFSFSSSKYMNILLNSSQGKYNLYLAQGSNITRLSDRINRRVVEPRGAEKTFPIRDLPPGDYVLAVQPLTSGENRYTIRYDQFDMNQAQAPPPSSVSASDPSRTASTVNNVSLFLGTVPGSTASFPLLVKCPGQVSVRASWSRGPKDMLVEISSQDNNTPVISKRGPSPLNITLNIPESYLYRGSKWSIDLTNISGGNSNISLYYETTVTNCIPLDQRLYRASTLEQNIDRLGGDYAHVPESSVYTCRKRCEQDSRCVAFTFSYGDRICHLKNTVTKPSHSTCCASGVVAIRKIYSMENSNLQDLDYIVVNASSAGDCQVKCYSDLRCKAYTFVKQRNACYLKEGIPQYSSYTGLTSGRVKYSQATLETNTNRWGGDYEHRLLLSPSADQCRLACIQDSECKAFTYTSWDGACHLKNSVPPTSPCGGCTSGVVQIRTLSYELNSDRPLSDYWYFENPLNEPEICRLACAQDLRCTTYTYERPEYVGGTSLCFLKEGTPGLKPNNCCISGVLGR